MIWPLADLLAVDRGVFAAEHLFNGLVVVQAADPYLRAVRECEQPILLVPFGRRDTGIPQRPCFRESVPRYARLGGRHFLAHDQVTRLRREQRPVLIAGAE